MSQDQSLPNSLWAHTAPTLPEMTAFDGESRTDVAIVGGGYTGLSAALHLAEAGVSVILLEARDIGFGGSGRNVGLVNAGLWLMPDLVEERMGGVSGAALNAFLASAPDLVFSLIEKHGIACEATRNGTLHLASDAKGQHELEARWQQMKRRGAPVHLLSASETRSRTGSPRYLAAILDERAGTIQPLGYARGLASAARLAGARIHVNSPVTGLKPKGGGWQLATHNGRVSADKVILATNAYGAGLVPGLERGFVPVHFFQVASEPLPEEWRARILPERQGCWDTRKVMVSFRLDAGGRLVLGSIGGLPKTGAGGVHHWADRLTSHLFPGIGKLAWQEMWDGRIGMTPDALPRFHEPADGLVTCLGYNGRGIGPGTAFGRALATWVMKGETDCLPLNRSEPTAIPFRSLKAGLMEGGLQAIQHLRRIWF